MTRHDGQLIRRVILSGAALVLLALVWVTVARVTGRDGEARPRSGEAAAVDLEALIAFEKEPIPDDENAAEWLAAGAGAVVWSEAESGAVGPASGMPYEEWDDSTRAIVREALDRHRGALETMRIAVPLERSSYGIRYRDGIEAEMPDLLSLMRAARLLACEASVRFADDDPEAGLLALETMATMATSLYGESTLITFLIATAIERTAVTNAASAVSLDRPWVDADFLSELDSVLPTVDHGRELGRVLNAWREVIWAAVQRGETRWQMGPRSGLDIPADLTRGDLDAACAEVAALLQAPYGPNVTRISGLGQLIDGSEEGLGSDLDGFGKALGRAQSVAAQRQLVGAAIALRRTALECGAYPEDRPAIPELSQPDPFTGNDISYEVHSGSATLALVGAVELLDPITVGGMNRYIRPVVLPPAG